MSGHGAARHRPRPGIGSQVTKGPTSQGSPRPVPGLDACQWLCRVRRSLSLRCHPRWSPAWPISGASPSISTFRKVLPSPRKPSVASLNSMLSRKKPEAPRRIAAQNCDEPLPPRSSTIWSDGSPSNSRQSRANLRCPEKSAMPSLGWHVCAPSSIRASWSWTRMLLNSPFLTLPWVSVACPSKPLPR